MESELCACCHLRKAPEKYSVTDKSPSVCAQCVRHVGFADKRDKEHVRDWRDAYRSMCASYESRLRNLQTRHDDDQEDLAQARAALTEANDLIVSEFERLPVGDLRNALETDLVKAEREKAETAFRTRSRAMRVLWRVDRMHNIADGGDPESCKCGQPAGACDLLKVLTPFVEELDAWEAKEKERMNNGKRHGLPAEHPAAVEYMRSPYSIWRGPARPQGVPSR